jgi:pimeloyl-ACP methyl ester carboxylesterase
VDLPGFAGPRPAGFGASKDEYAEWLAAVLASIDGAIDLVGHDWGALLAVRIATAFEQPLRSWSVDAANAFHPDHVWPRSVRRALRAGADQEHRDDPVARLTRLGLSSSLARSMAATQDEMTCATVLALYRSAVPNVHAHCGADITEPPPAPGLVMLAAADPYGDEHRSCEMARRLDARTVRRMPPISSSLWAADGRYRVYRHECRHALARRP